MSKKHINVRSLLAAAVLAAGTYRATRGHMTHDVAFQYRMGTNIVGDVNRMHPASIEPCMMSASAPTLAYGRAVICDTSNQVRTVQAGDTAITKIWGLGARPYPTQQTNGGMTSDFGDATPPAGLLDVLRMGYMMVKCVGTPKKGDPVFVWVAANSGSDKQGQLRTTASAGNTAAITNAVFNSPAVDGVAEVVVWY